PCWHWRTRLRTRWLRYPLTRSSRRTSKGGSRTRQASSSSPSPGPMNSSSQRALAPPPQRPPRSPLSTRSRRERGVACGAAWEVELSAGVIEYRDSGGDGPVLVFLHGVAMDGSVWQPVVDDLRRDYRCIVPTLPLGGHRQPMRPGADLSLRGFGRMAGELLER